MNRYDHANIHHSIDGYYFPKPNEVGEEAFERAKAELIKNLQKRLEQTKQFTFENFQSRPKP